MSRATNDHTTERNSTFHQRRPIQTGPGQNGATTREETTNSLFFTFLQTKQTNKQTCMLYCYIEARQGKEITNGTVQVEVDDDSIQSSSLTSEFVSINQEGRAV